MLAKLGIDAAWPKGGGRKRLLGKAEDAFDQVMSAKRFWRAG